MDMSNIEEVATTLADAWRAEKKIYGLPDRLRVSGFAQAHAIQDEMVSRLEETVAGWKVGGIQDGVVARGAIVASRVYSSPAQIPQAKMPMMGIEPEVAFRFERPLPAREKPYSYEEVAAACSAFLALEIVDSRFRDYPDNPLPDRVADLVSNGGFVEGPAIENWQDVDLVNLRVTVEMGGAIAGDQTAGHVRKDPLLPAVELANQMRLENGVPAGTFMTTGTYCGLVRAEAGMPVICCFEKLGLVEVRFD